MASYMGMFTYQNLFRDSLQYDPLVSVFDQFLADGLEKRP
jgi:hypothetical protein